MLLKVVNKSKVSPSLLRPNQALWAKLYDCCPSPKGTRPAKQCPWKLPREASLLTHLKLVHQGDITLSLWPEIPPETAERLLETEVPDVCPDWPLCSSFEFWRSCTRYPIAKNSVTATYKRGGHSSRSVGMGLLGQKKQRCAQDERS